MLRPLLPHPRGQGLTAKHGGLSSTSRHICPRGWGASSAGGRPNPAPVDPPRPSLSGRLLREIWGAPPKPPPPIPPSPRGVQMHAPLKICRPLGDCGGSPEAPAPAPPSPWACRSTPPLKNVARWATAGAPPKPLPPHLPPLGRAEARPLFSLNSY